MNKKVLPYRQTFLTLKVIISSFIFIVLSTNILQSQCPQFISVSTQAEIDNFLIDYPNCTEIEEYVSIWSGDDIVNLDGLSNIVSIGGWLNISSCPILENIDGLSNLSHVGQSITVEHCNILDDLVGLGNVASYNGLEIIGCDSLVSLNGLENISSTASMFKIDWCQSLTDLTTFPNLGYIDGNASISGLTSLANISGLENLDSISGFLSLHENHVLTSIDGLESLIAVGGGLSLYKGYTLEDIGGLSGLKSIGSNLEINKCNSLISLSGLDSLTHIGGSILVDENNSLQSLSGIDNIEAESIQNLSITYNPQLSTCEVQSVCDYLANPNGDIQIYVNATGCNNSVEVTEACTVGIPEKASDTPLTAYPNPFTTSTTIEYELTEPSHVQLTIYNAIGETIYEAVDCLMLQGMHTFTWRPEGLPEGMYYAVLRSVEGVSVVKMVK